MRFLKYWALVEKYPWLFWATDMEVDIKSALAQKPVNPLLFGERLRVSVASLRYLVFKPIKLLPSEEPLRESNETRDLSHKTKRALSITWKILWHMPNEDAFSRGIDLESVRDASMTIGSVWRELARKHPNAVIDAVVRNLFFEHTSLDPNPAARLTKSIFDGKSAEAYEIFINPASLDG